MSGDRLMGMNYYECNAGVSEEATNDDHRSQFDESNQPLLLSEVMARAGRTILFLKELYLPDSCNLHRPKHTG